MIAIGHEFGMVVSLSRGLPVRFKSARVVLVACENRTLVDMMARMGIAHICCVREMAAARALCDAGGIDACLVVLPPALPDDKPDWDSTTDAPGGGRVRSLLMVEAATQYVRRSAADAGYYAVSPRAISARMLYRCIAALLQGRRRRTDVAGKPGRPPRPRMRRLGVVGTLGGETAPKLQ
jgi:hypothetical protein